MDLLDGGTVENQGPNVPKTLNDSVPGTEPGNSVLGTDPRTGAKSAVPTSEKDLESDKVPDMGLENGEMNNNGKLDSLPKIWVQRQNFNYPQCFCT